MACVETSLKDRINELHDDILVHILSFSTLKEAGRTSILSKRWRDLWAYVPILHFDSDILSGDVNLSISVELAMEEEEPKYLNWVDQVMSSHKAPTINEFRVQFNLLSKDKDNVDNWVRSAMEKRVKKFQLDVGPWSCTNLGSDRYSLPSLSLFTSLTSLELSQVDVSSDVLEKLLHDCPLEHLSVYHSHILANLKVVGPSLNLKTLKLYGCFPAHDLEISAPHLTSFDYSGEVLNNLLFKSIPKLTEFSIGLGYAERVMDDPSSLSSCSSQIEVLTLEIDYSYDRKHIGRIAEAFPVWTKLKTTHLRSLYHKSFGTFNLK